MQFTTDFADQAVILPLALVVGLALLTAGWVRGAMSWWFAVCATLGTMLVLKLGFIACGDRVPELGLHTPSGHTASAAVVYGGLLGLALPRGGYLLARIALVAALAALFGTTRVELGAHSVPETLVGGAVGLAGALLLVCLAGDRPASPHSRQTGVIIASVVVGISVLLHGRHLGAESVINRAALTIWPLSECR